MVIESTPMALMQAAELFRAVFDRSPAGLFVYDTDLVVRECNDVFLSLLNAGRDLVIGLDMRRIPDKRFLPTVEAALLGEATSYMGEYIAPPSNETVIVVLRCTPLRDLDGTVSGAFGILEDDTQRARMESDLREQLALVQRQAATIRALGTPILKVWDQVLCLPVIGVVDSARAAEMTETMLRSITRDRTRFAVIDLTGVELLDTATAQHLMQLFRAASLVGTEAVLCGIRPAIAQTVIDLGIDMTTISTKRTMYDALKYCLMQLEVSRTRRGG